MATYQPYKEPRTCHCGFSTIHQASWCRHKKNCVQPVQSEHSDLQLKDAQLAQSKEQLLQVNQQLKNYMEQLVQMHAQIAVKDAQIATKDEQIAAKDEQIAAKDAQISELIKRPRTVTNNNTINNLGNNVNIFGNESMEHISEAEIKRLLSDPATAVPKLIRLKRAVASNVNVRVPNKKQNIYQVVRQDAEGNRQWQNIPKTEALEALYNEGAGVLEIEASEEDSKRGDRFIDFHDRVKDSSHGDKKLYHSQLESIHCVVTEPVTC